MAMYRSKRKAAVIIFLSAIGILLYAAVIALAIKANADINGSYSASRDEVVAFPIITATGSTEVLVIKGGWNTVAYNYYLSAMQDTVRVKLEGSHNKLRWVNLDTAGERTHSLADSMGHGYLFTGASVMPFIRLTVTSAQPFSMSVSAKLGR
ncbi:MAG: hypothetical protein ACYC3W_10560 [Candidatus Nanopelagicales bacterium]